MEGQIWFIIIAQGIICAGLSANIAWKKGHSGLAYLLAGFLFGIFGLIAAAGLPYYAETPRRVLSRTTSHKRAAI